MSESKKAKSKPEINNFNTPTHENAVEKTKAQNKERLLKELREHHGIVTRACEAAGLDRGTYYNYRDSDPEFVKAADDVIEQTIDVAEGVVWGLMFDSEDDKVRLNAAKLVLDAKGKKRGFGTERRQQEISGSLETKSSVIVRLPDNGRRSYSGATTRPTD